MPGAPNSGASVDAVLGARAEEGIDDETLASFTLEAQLRNFTLASYRRSWIYRNSTWFVMSSDVRTSAINIAPPMITPMDASRGANTIPA